MQHRLNREVRAKVLNDTVSSFCKDDVCIISSLIGDL